MRVVECEFCGTDVDYRDSVDVVAGDSVPSIMASTIAVFRQDGKESYPPEQVWCTTCGNAQFGEGEFDGRARRKRNKGLWNVVNPVTISSFLLGFLIALSLSVMFVW